MKKDFILCKEVINKEMALYLYDYLLLKRQVFQTLFNNRLISSLNIDWGAWGDTQVSNTYCAYGDIALDLLLSRVKPLMEKKTGLELIETYSYARVYKKGDVLKKHKDRISCQISATMNLGGDPWPIYLNLKNKKAKKFILDKGDMLIYKGDKVFHWRDKFEGNYCGQVFLHYNNIKTSKNRFDGRAHLGLPEDIKNVK
jgi:hypothetical protein